MCGWHLRQKNAALNGVPNRWCFLCNSCHRCKVRCTCIPSYWYYLLLVKGGAFGKLSHRQAQPPAGSATGRLSHRKEKVEQLVAEVTELVRSDNSSNTFPILWQRSLSLSKCRGHGCVGNFRDLRKSKTVSLQK